MLTSYFDLLEVFGNHSIEQNQGRPFKFSVEAYYNYEELDCHSQGAAKQNYDHRRYCIKVRIQLSANQIDRIFLLQNDD